MPDLDYVMPGISVVDGCPILRRIKSFIVQEGVPSTLQYTFRNANTGAPINLNADFVSVSEPANDSSNSESVPPEDNTALVKFREFTGYDNGQCQPIIAEGRITDPENGIAVVGLPRAVYGQSGIYTASWGYVRAGELKLAQNAILSVERTLFGFDTPAHFHTKGPPTIGEIRMQMMDSDPGENPLLSDVEFADEQILIAIAKPVQYFNETNPPLHQQFDTRSFPWKSAWLDAILGHLCMFAAAHYRRNRLRITGGGKELDALNREKEYTEAGQRYLEEWRNFVLIKKVEINARGFVGSLGSDYGRLSGYGYGRGY